MRAFLGEKIRVVLWWPNLVKQIQKEDIRKALSVKERENVLDVGTGPGHFSAYLKRQHKSANVVAGDLYRKPGWDRFLPELPFVQFDAARMPFPPNTFHRILLSEILTILKDSQSALLEAARVLRPEGKLVVVNGTGYGKLRGFYENPGLARIRNWLISHMQLPSSYFRFYRSMIAINIAASEREFRSRIQKTEVYLENELHSSGSFSIENKSFSFSELNEVLLTAAQILRAVFGLGRPRFNYMLLYPLSKLIEIFVPSKKGLSVIYEVSKAE